MLQPAWSQKHRRNPWNSSTAHATRNLQNSALNCGFWFWLSLLKFWLSSTHPMSMSIRWHWMHRRKNLLKANSGPSIKRTRSGNLCPREEGDFDLWNWIWQSNFFLSSAADDDDVVHLAQIASCKPMMTLPSIHPTVRMRRGEGRIGRFTVTEL